MGDSADGRVGIADLGVDADALPHRGRHDMYAAPRCASYMVTAYDL